MQLPPDKVNPGSQAMPQAVPLQVATPLAGATQALQVLPQVAVLVLETQVPPQA